MEYISLRETTSDDFEDYYKIRCSPSDVYWNGYTSIPEKNSFRSLFNSRLSSAPFRSPEDRRLYLICIDDNDSSRSVGFIQLIRRETAVEIGYSVMDEYQGLGIATKALKMAIQIAKAHNLDIIVRIRDDNTASQKVAIKNGFIPTEQFVIKFYPGRGEEKLRVYTLQSCLTC